MFPKTRIVAHHVIAEAEPPDVTREQGPQPFLALTDGQRARTRAFEKQKVEHEEHQLIGVAFIHGRLQAAEGRHAVELQRAQLAIELDGLHRQRPQRLYREAVAKRPVEPDARQQHRSPARQSRMHAVAVVLDFMKPNGAGRCVISKTRQLWLDPLRRLCAFSSTGRPHHMPVAAGSRRCLFRSASIAPPCTRHGLSRQ